MERKKDTRWRTLEGGVIESREQKQAHVRVGIHEPIREIDGQRHHPQPHTSKTKFKWSFPIFLKWKIASLRRTQSPADVIKTFHHDKEQASIRSPPWLHLAHDLCNQSMGSHKIFSLLLSLLSLLCKKETKKTKGNHLLTSLRLLVYCQVPFLHSAIDPWLTR